ncbi:2-C-methyl-D-erythritol 4-phosphate cytidylyltransferase [Saccharomonospora sp. CUA-673]|uniref:IspD/TarI family cytidylyltransferase n=1 Tax=Saccharomonospora sp. CUA-673 TaxID=1904969 RepID=UPI002101C840|nr:2-C-methyl-D-erythritol 4-phosphate cytidylyltransferase [Saccharomonospora sp. CUA-673]
MLVRGEPLLSHAVHGLLDSGCVDRIVVAGPARHRAVGTPSAVETPADPRVHVVDTAEDDPLRAGLTATAAAADDVVLVHDPARPFVPAAVLRSAIDTVDTHVDVAVPVLPVADTVKVVDADGVVRGTRDRTHLRHVQSPLAFRAAALERALAPGARPTRPSCSPTRTCSAARSAPSPATRSACASPRRSTSPSSRPC